MLYQWWKMKSLVELFCFVIVPFCSIDTGKYMWRNFTEFHCFINDKFIPDNLFQVRHENPFKMILGYLDENQINMSSLLFS